jgi:DNA-binding SARP family transcriptional activator
MWVSLLNGFDLKDAERSICLPPSGQRVIAYLGVRNRPVRRSLVAMTLWPDLPEARAQASLRSALWRLRSAGCFGVSTTDDQLALGAGVAVDLWETVACAHTVLDGQPGWERGALDRLAPVPELLPEWYDDWILIERERVRQLAVHALEVASRRLVERGAHATAIELGLAVVAAEPLRESAHQALIEAYLAEGNRAEALRQYRTYRDLMRRELGLPPSSRIAQLVGFTTPA